MENKITSIAHFSAYLPKACGIATYAVALRKTIQDRIPDLRDLVVAIDETENGHKYPSIVKYHFYDMEIANYIKAAEFINQSDVQIVNIQHEFGLYGSKVNPETLGQDDGKNFLLFLRALNKPAVTTLHMVYKNPPPAHKIVVQEICRLSKKIVVLAHIAKKFLIEKYGIPLDRVVVIPHGAPNVPRYATGFFKEMLGYSKNDFTISSFGLIRAKKGYEYLIEAMPRVLKEYPGARLMIIGKTHPQRSPEYYRSLKKKVRDLKISDQVRFVNKFVTYADLINYLMASNVFVAPFLVMDQVSSGSLIYAMAAGRACIATPFDYAKEALADRRGILVSPKKSEALAKEIIYLIEHPKARHRMQNIAYSYARKQTWSKISKEYIKLFNQVAEAEYDWRTPAKSAIRASTRSSRKDWGDHQAMEIAKF